MAVKSSQLNIDLNATVLSSRCAVYKTAAFSAAANRLRKSDLAVSKIAEALIALRADKDSLPFCDNGYFTVSFGQRGEYEFSFATGAALPSPLEKSDVVFYAFGGDGSKDLRLNDRRLEAYLKDRKNFSATVFTASTRPEDNAFDKLYRVSGAERVDFPMLNPEQRAVVEAEDGNILVQGVAGSGKTNLCIDKIVFAASRGYLGKVLYSTYSRGLLADTQLRVNAFAGDIENFVAEYTHGRVRFTDADHKKAVENKLGIYFDVDEDDKIAAALTKIADFLRNKVDYMLIEDIYRKYADGRRRACGENYFISSFVPAVSHRAEGALARVKELSYEVVYKEIYGYIFGKADLDDPARIMSKEEYVAARSGTLTPQECEAIYRISREYSAHLAANGLTDNNHISRRLLASSGNIPIYSLAVLDEVQDLTEINLLLMKNISRKMFCVGDALQMINPSYFSFGFLKRLMYSSETVTIRVLRHNYRNTPRIAEIVESLNDLNIARFGTHNFVLRSRAVDSETETSAVYVRGNSLVNLIAEHKLDNYTLVVSSDEVKKKLRPVAGNREILTVSEVKGLERDTVILYDLLSDHKDKWAAIERAGINRKSADENSVYRYYFNLFYVGVSRAKAHVYVTESARIPFFDKFFAAEFACLTPEEAVKRLEGILSRTEIDDADLAERIEEFMRLGQYANARVALDRLRDDDVRSAYKDRIDVHEEFISRGYYREAGVRYWEKSLYDDAREMFSLSGDKLLLEFMDACLSDSDRALDYGIVRYFADVGNNDVARKLIINTVRNDLEAVKKNQSSLNASLKALRRSKEKKNG